MNQIVKKKLLEKFKDSTPIDIYCNYINKLVTDKDWKTKAPKNPWAKHVENEQWINYFLKVTSSGLYIDGESVTINNNGISLNYQAYKNLVLIRYPETVFDIQLVKEGDEFNFSKTNGKINYNHILVNPFKESKVIGGYAVIKNKSGEFLEVITLNELEKIRSTAKTKTIWDKWLNEMYLKTIIKRACKRHFRDVTDKLDIEDNNQFSLEEENIYLTEEEQENILKLIEESKADKAKLLKFCNAKEVKYIHSSLYKSIENQLENKVKITQKNKENDNT